MTYTPAIPLSGLLGWRVFNESMTRQFDAFSDTAAVKRDVAYFRENIENAKSPKDLIEDRRLLTVALGAFGLEEEIDKKAIIRKVLEEGTDIADSFANRLADNRWKDFAKEFGYGNVTLSRVDLPEFQDKVAQQYLERSFEARVGDVDGDMRLAMNFRREAARIAADPTVERTGWFKIMGQRPLRAVVETALGLPAQFATVNIDKQKEVLEDRALDLFGEKSPTIFADPEVVDDMLRKFFLQSEIANGPSQTTRGVGAISLLSASPASSAQTINLIISNAL